LETHYNLNPQIDKAEKKRRNWFLQNAILTEIDFLQDEPESYKGIYYDESEE
jgi:hypothetical protein